MSIYDELLEANPPIGLMPHAEWISQRRQELSQAIARYCEAGRDGDQIVKLWAKELSNLIDP